MAGACGDMGGNGGQQGRAVCGQESCQRKAAGEQGFDPHAFGQNNRVARQKDVVIGDFLDAQRLARRPIQPRKVACADQGAGGWDFYRALR